MKRLLTLAAMSLCCMATTFAQFSGSGSGTESDPYLILNPIQLNQLRNYLNQSGVYFKLMADIDLTEFIEDEYSSQGWQPVGTSSTPFKGILDGNGKTVSGIKISRGGSDYVGFFGNLDGGTVKNLTLTGGTVNGGNYVGFMSGNGGTVLDCTIAGKVNGVKGDGYSYVGGCVGYGGNCTRVKSTVDVCGYNYVGGICGANGAFNECTVTNNYVEGNNFVGGICGLNNLGSYYDDNKSPMKDCHVNTIRIVGGDYVGGICGQIKNKGYTIRIVDVENCCFIGEINANSYVGGVCGEYTGIGKMKRCFGIGNISVNQNYGGGLIGSSESGYGPNDANDITNSYFCGSIYGKEMIGGLIGYKYNGTVKCSYSNVNVNGTRNVGGLLGKLEGYYSILLSNVAIATYVKATEGNVGRIYGLAGNNVNIGEMGTSNENKAWNRAIVINAGVAQDVTDEAQNGSGVSKTTLKLKATYVAMGWDFTDVWDIQETECYPYMKSQTAPPVITSQLVSGATTISGKCVDGGTVTLEVDGVTQQMVSTGHEFSFTVSPLQAGHEVRISTKAEDKEQSYFTTETVQYLGSGKENDPYQIYTASDLTGVYRKGYFKLMNDIDLTDYINQFSPTEGWESIGREGSETIHFDGDGHKVTGLWCNSTRDNTGLFSCFANGTIKNLTVETAIGKQVKGGANTGILIGKMINGAIENCRVSGTVADGTPVGGMVGLFDGGKISLSQANVTINTTGEKSYVGGLVGEITNGEIDQCSTLGTVTATGMESYVGGLVGKNSATVTNCYSNAIVTSTYNAAGLIAYNYGVVDKCYATGNIFSSNYGAGVVGYNDGENAVVRNSAAMNNKIDVTYESQQVQQGGGYGQRIIGGIKNGAPAPELNNYALKTMQVSLNNVPQRVYDDIMNGVGKNESDLTKGSTYQELGWDFTNIWKIAEGRCYPVLLSDGVRLDKSEVIVKKKNTVTLKATFYPETLEDKSVTWKSSDETVATVSSSGKVKGIKSGVVTITCTSNATGLSATCKVTVATIALNKSEVIVKKKKSVTLKPTVYPTTLADKSVKWKSSDKTIATVSSSGKVTGVKSGVVTITCTSNATGVSTTCKVTVATIALNKKEAIVRKKKTLTLTPTVYPTTLEDKSVTWKSSDESIATVSSDGVVTGVKSGVVTITCTSNATGVSTTCTVTVGTITLNKSSVTLAVDNKVTLKPTVYPTTLEDQSVTWKSSNKAVATVSKTGKVTALKAGTATITCTSNATGLSTTCKVTVTASASARTLDDEDSELTDIEIAEVAPDAEEPFDVYDLKGHRVLHQVTSLDGLPAGVYIVNGKKVLKK